MSAADLAASITNSQWRNRVIYSWAVTGVLLVGLIACSFMGAPEYIIHALSGLLALQSFLVMVAPSAEQVVKMLAQVKAIKNGS